MSVLHLETPPLQLEEIFVSEAWAGKARSTDQSGGSALRENWASKAGENPQAWLSGTFIHLSPGC